MTFLFIRQTVRQSQNEYNQLLISEKALLKSEKELLNLNAELKASEKQLQVLNSELKASEKQLQEWNSELVIKVKERTQELELVNEQRTNAFINLAHETKTPLTLITNYLDEYIKKNALVENEELNLLKKAIGHLTKDIVNFFDLEKIQKGFNMYNHNYISDLSTALNESVSLFKVFSAKKQIQITADITKDIFIKADPSSLCRIINNLIENAIKYTSEGGKIKIDLKSEKGRIHFSIKDNGIGIPSFVQDKIFEPYFQINSEKANFQGMGLGLPIVKRIVTELSGEIQIKSDSNEGTEIVIDLPFYEKSDKDFVLEFTDDTTIYYEVEKLNICEQRFDPDKSTIMIVDDNIQWLTYFVKGLQKKYNIYYASNGVEAVEKLKALKHLDLIISDVMMDNGDGLLLYKHILANDNFNHIPFIFLTAKITLEDRIEGLSLGAIDYISKPVSIKELEIKINSLLKILLNQRNAIIRNAYNSLGSSKEVEQTIPNNVSMFEYNCYKYNLSDREKDVIQLAAKGKTDKEIGDCLFISYKTVKKHLQNSYAKVGVNTRLEVFNKLHSENTPE